MATIRLVPSTYAVSNSSYAKVTDASNMYHNTDNTTHATLQNTRNSTRNTYYVYIRGFNFDSVPSDAIVSSFTVKIKANESYMSTSSSYRPSLYHGTTAISNTTVTSSLSTSVTTLTFPTGSLTWDTIKGYGANFGIRVPMRRSSTSYSSYVYVYGAEIEVTYTVPVYHSVTITNSTSATVTASDSNPLEGTDVTIMSDTISGIAVTDNGTDVTSQFVHHSGTTGEYTIENRGSYGFALSDGYYVSQNKGVDKTAAVCRVSFVLPVASTVTFTYINYAEQGYDFGVFGNLDTELSTNYYSAGSSGATITDNSYKLACNTSTHNQSTTQTLTYSNVSAGEHYIDVKYSKDDASADNNDTLQFKVAITYNEAVSYYAYTITNIQADHAIIVSPSGGGGEQMYVKVNGAWVAVTAVYKKVNGSWVQQSNLSSLFNTSTKYVLRS